VIKFEITSQNMFFLAKLADKYEIEHLRRDIQRFTLTLVLSNDKVSWNLWTFAACNGFTELERYCRADRKVEAELMAVIRDRERGIVHLVHDEGVPLALMSEIVANLICGNAWV